MKDSHLVRFGNFAIASLAIGLGGPSACGHGDMDVMSNHSAAFDDHAITYQAALDSHGAAVQSAVGLSQIAVLEADHVSYTQPHMNAMSHELGDMMGCVGPAGEQPHSWQVLGDLDRIQKEADDHRAAMAGAIDIAPTRAEEARHQGQMMGMMADMQTHARTMVNGIGHYNCSHHSR